MEDVLSRAWAQVKWEEDVASQAKAQLKQDHKVSKQAKTDQEEASHQKREAGGRSRNQFPNQPLERIEGMNMSTWPAISNVTISKPELIHVLRQIVP